MRKYTSLFREYIKRSTEKQAVKHNLTIVLGDKKYSNLLDIGCGTGEVLEPVLNQFENIVALDKELRLEEKYLNRSNIEFIKSDFFDYQTDDKFDIILAAYVLWEIPFDQWSAFFDKAKTILKPGGKLIIIDKCPDKLFDNSFFEFNTGLFQDSGYPDWDDYIKTNSFVVRRHFFQSNIKTPDPEQMYDTLRFFFQNPEKENYYRNNRNKIIKDLQNKTGNDGCVINFNHSIDIFSFNHASSSPRTNGFIG